MRMAHIKKKGGQELLSRPRRLFQGWCETGSSYISDS